MSIMARINNYFYNLLQREDGQGLAEYGLILALVAVAGIVGLGALALAISGTWGDVTALFP